MTHDPEATLAEELHQLIGTFERLRRRDRLLAFGARTTTVAGSGSITVLVALQGSSEPHPHLRFAALVLGVVVTIVAAWDVFLRPKDLWIARTDTLGRLQNLHRRVRYRAGATDVHLAELEGILDDYRHTRTTNWTSRPVDAELQATDVIRPDEF